MEIRELGWRRRWLAAPLLLSTFCAALHAQSLPQPGIVASISGNAAVESDDPNSRSWSDVIPDMVGDQKDLYLGYPNRLLHGRDWLPTVLVVGAVGTLVATDQFDARPFRKTSDFKQFNTAFSSTNTFAVIVAVPAVTYLAGFLKHDTYAQSTALLAGEALVDSEILDEAMKLATRRQRPERISVTGNFADNWTESKWSSGSFPSGHTVAAFSVATIMSRRYGPTHRWVPYVSYGLASAVGVSRVTLSAHYVSDVAMGAALGYVVSRFVVLRPHHNTVE